MAESDFKNFNSQLLRLIECTVCLEYMKKPIFLCEQGHNVCGTCVPRLRDCPMCRQRITKNCRNYTLEVITDLLQYPCENANNGCPLLFKRNDLVDHQNECNFRLYSCILEISCNWKGLRGEILEHAAKFHEDRLMLGPEIICCVNFLSPLKHSVRIIRAFGENFYAHRKLVSTGMSKTMCWTLQYIGNPEDTTQYGFTLEISSNEYVNRRAVFTEICHDDVKTVDDIIESQLCVMVPHGFLEHFQDVNFRVYNKLKIIRT